MIKITLYALRSARPTDDGAAEPASLQGRMTGIITQKTYTIDTNHWAPRFTMISPGNGCFKQCRSRRELVCELPNPRDPKPAGGSSPSLKHSMCASLSHHVWRLHGFPSTMYGMSHSKDITPLISGSTGIIPRSPRRTLFSSIDRAADGFQYLNPRVLS